MSGAWLVLFIALWAVSAMLVVLVIGLSRRIQILESLTASADRHGRDPAPERFLGKNFSEHAIESGVATRTDGIAGVFLFLSEHCGPCQQLSSDIASNLDASGAKGLAGAIGNPVVIITDQSGTFDQLGATKVVIDQDESIRRGFEVNGTPVGIALDREGAVVEALIANRFEDVQKLSAAIHVRDTIAETVMSA